MLPEDRVLYKGEPVVAVVATSEEAARAGAAAVEIEFEDLPAVLDVEEALADGATAIKPHGTNYFVYEGHHCRRIRFGDVERAFATADHVFEWRYQSSPIEHAPTETTGCIVVPQGDGRLKIHSDTQACFFTLDNTALILDVPFGKLRVVGGTVGGGFGGKVDVIVEPIACIAAMATDKPVKYVYGREEEMQISSPRAAERIYVKDGVMDDGTIVARKVTLYVDAGAYSRHSPYGTTKAAAHMPGPYNIPNVWVDAHCVYTNRTPSSAMRGFGVTIADWALESQIDRIARELGMDPLELRLKNAYRDGDMKAHRKLAEGTALIEVIQRAADLVGHDLPGASSRRCRPRRLGDGQAARPRLCGGQLPDRHEPGRRPVPGADPLDHDGELRRDAVERRPRPGDQDDRGAVRGRDARAALREHPRRHGRHRHRTALHGHVRLARHPPRRQRGDHGREGGARGDAEVAADELEVDPDDLETDGTGFVRLKGSEEKKIHIVDLALRERDGLGSGADEAGHAGSALDHGPRLVGHPRQPIGAATGY